MTKLFLAIYLSLFSWMANAATVYETVCKSGDCFKYGWTTTSTEFTMLTTCKNDDCTKYGWSSRANDGTLFDVSCKDGGCFTDGWYSTQKFEGNTGNPIEDDVICRNSSCLEYGWTAINGFDLMGGEVTCNNSNCAKYGGTSLWRGRVSSTTCHENACYQKGWTLYIH